MTTTGNHLAEIKLDRARPLPPQIYAQVRALILSGVFAPEDKIPSTHELAKLWNMRAPTVHSGLAPLVKDGLLVRYPKIGTFVQKREEKLTCVGIYYFSDVWGKNGSLYLQSVHAALKAELEQLGIELDVWLDPRPHGQTGEPWLPFAKAARDREFQALIVTGIDLPTLRWLTKLPVPAAFQVPANIPNRVHVEREQFAELSLRALAAQGCRSVGLIAPLTTRVAAHNADLRVPDPFFERFVDVSHDLGLTVKDSWMRVLPHEDALGGRSQEAFGYEHFMELWQQDTKPDGLVVFPDTSARGVLMGIHAQHVRVPEDLKLALHKNEGVDLLCPLPATLVISSEREIAHALVVQVQKQFRGETCEPIHIGFTVAPAENAGKP